MDQISHRVLTGSIEASNSMLYRRKTQIYINKNNIVSNFDWISTICNFKWYRRQFTHSFEYLQFRFSDLFYIYMQHRFY